ncbi:MAG TPA: LLM class F420-dependent oxidoreductase [Acidimicrobiia bacterium]|nr:LLM class F420-dependent oxidoreductase [Acidimicrobiia bacterium]
MRFGAFVSQGWRLDLVGIPVEDQWATMQTTAKVIESIGFESLWVYDHFHTVPVATQEETYEAWTLMAALAAVTDTVRLGQMCTCNGYRHPSYLAKVAASIDAISGGRLEMGIGAGWYEHEFKGYGYPFPKPSVRIGELREAVEIMQRLWTEDTVDYQGTHYTLQGGICRPRPIQQPHIPFWIAGGGEQLTLNVAARFAQYTNFGDDLDTFTRKSEILASHCMEVGRDFDTIVRSANFNVICEETEADVEDKRNWFVDHYTPFLGAERARKQVAKYFKSGMVGTPEQLTERLAEWQRRGMTYAISYFAGAAYDTSGMERFAREVIPALGD